MRVVLIRKLAECVDGVDLSRCEPGETLRLSDRDGSLLVAEGWARPVAPPARACASDVPRDQLLSRVAGNTEGFRDATEVPRRRAEDYVREELREERARIVSPAPRARAAWEDW